MRVIPVAGYDSMLLNLSGAHAPFFTRNVILLTDNAGRMGAGEVPGGERIREVLEQARELVVGANIGDHHGIIACVLNRFAECDAAGRGLQTFDQRVAVHAAAAIESALLDLLGSTWKCLSVRFSERGLNASAWMCSDICSSSATRVEAAFRTGMAPRSGRVATPSRPGNAHGCGAGAPCRSGAGSVRFPRFHQGRSILRQIRNGGSGRACQRFPKARITIDPNGAWSLEEAIALCRDQAGVIAYAEDPCGGENGYSGREIMAEFRAACSIPTATNMIATDWRQLGHAARLHAIDILLADPHFWSMSGSVRASQFCRDWGLTWGSHSNNHFDISLAMFTQVAAAAVGSVTAIDTHWIWQEGQRLTREPLRIEDGAIAAPKGPA